VASHFALYALPVLDLLEDRPLITHFHGPWAAESAANDAPQAAVEQVKAVIERTVYRRSDRCIVLSEAFGQVLVSAYGVAPERVRRVPGGVDVDAFAVDGTPADARQRLTWPQNRPIVLAVRRLVPRMGLEQLIDAIAIVRQDVPDVLVLIAGKGPLQDELQNRIDALELQDHVRLLGFLPEADLPYAYRAATLTIVPTVSLEGFGLITLESMAAGTPPLVTPVGGLPEAVSSLSPELVLDAATTPAIADGLTAALHGRRPLPSSAACEAHVRAHHDWPVIAGRIAKVYREVLPV
jgi:glycosyltransferase involved in cell wall biosynthesis